MAQLNFDASQVEPDTGFDTVPAGWYNVMMDESDTKPTKDGTGTYLQARFNILDGQYRGRKLFARLNIRNANATAQEIALRQLSAIGHAVNVLQIADSQQLHGIPLKVKVKIRKGDDNYEDQNEIISYKNIDEPVDVVGGAPAAGAPQAGFGAPPMPNGFGAPPMQQPPAQQGFQQGFQQQPPIQQFQQPPAQQPQQPPMQQDPNAGAQQPWAQAPMQQQAPQQQQFQQPPAQDPANPFGGQQQQQQQQQPQQPWNGGQAPAQGAAVQQQAPAQDPALAAGVAAAQGAAPPWAQQAQ